MTQNRAKYTKQPESSADLLLPMANISRAMKDAIPRNGKLSKEAKDCMQACVTEFVAFITSEAAEISNGAKRKTINGQDVCHALMSLGMENYSEVLAIYLARYRDHLQQKGYSDSECQQKVDILHRQMTVGSF